MKILFLNNVGLHEHQGKLCCEPNTGKFAKELLELGNDVIFYGQRIGRGDSVHTFCIEDNGMKVISLQRKKYKLYNYLCLYLKLFFIIKKVDFVYIYYPTSFRFVPCICKLMGVKYGLYIRGMYGVNDRLSTWNYKNALTVFTVSESFTNLVNNIVGCNKAETIRPMIPFTEKDIVYNRSYDCNKKCFEILFLARVAEDKGVKELFAALSKLKQEGYCFHVTFVGDGEFFEKSKTLAKSLDIEDLIDIRGAIYDVEEKKRCFLNSDIYVLPTYHEGFPRTLYEAMIFGTPIVTTFVGSISGLMKDGINCKRIEPRSVDSTFEGLQFAMNNYCAMIEFAKNSFKIVYNIVDSRKLTHAQSLNNIINNKIINL